MTALVLATAAFAGLTVIGDIRARRRLRRTFTTTASGATASKPRRKHRSATPAPSPIPSPLLLELLAALLESGAPPPTALRHLAAALTRTGDARGERLEALAMELERGIIGGTAVSAADEPADRGRVRGLLRRRKRASADDANDAALPVLRGAVRMAALAGLPPAALVRRAATEERRRLGAARRRAIRRLEVFLVLPVGLCLLPAFILLGVIPVVIDLFGG